MDQSIHDATELRKKEHVEYQASSKELSVAATLIDKATKRLEEYYSPKASAKAAFLSTAVAKPHYTTAAARRLAAGFDDVLLQKHDQTMRQKKSSVDPIVLP